MSPKIKLKERLKNVSDFRLASTTGKRDHKQRHWRWRISEAQCSQQRQQESTMVLEEHCPLPILRGRQSEFGRCAHLPLFSTMAKIFRRGLEPPAKSTRVPSTNMRVRQVISSSDKMEPSQCVALYLE